MRYTFPCGITFPSADENVYGKFTIIGIDKGKYKYLLAYLPSSS